MKRMLLFLALIAWSSMASAIVYRWVDANGKVQYGDRPPDGVKAEVVQLLSSHPGVASEAGRPAASNPASSASAKPVSTNGSDAALKQEVSQDVSQTKDKQCTEAQERYKKLIEGRRLYKEGANGERQYLSSEEIDSQRLNAKRDIDAICNSQN